MAALRLVHVVRGDQHGGAAARQLVDLLPELAAADRVHPGRRLVEEEQGRGVDGGAGEGHALLPAARERAGDLVAPVGEPALSQHLLHAGGADARGHAVQSGVEAQILVHREILVEAEALGHVADALLDPLGLGGHVVAHHRAVAAAGIEDSAQHADGGRLAGAVGAQHAEDLTAVHAQRDVLHRDEVAEAARKVLRHDDRVAFSGALRAHRRASAGCAVRSIRAKAGTPACSCSAGSSTSIRTRTTRLARSRGLNR